MSWYLDSSAILKFIFAESERSALLKIITSSPVSSEIARVEVKRAVSRIDPSKVGLASEELAKIRFVDVSKSVLLFAENFSSSMTLKALDSIHVATAAVLGESIRGIITYDKQMAINARNLGMVVLSPGAD